MSGVVARCMRCPRKAHRGRSRAWNAVLRQGVVVGYLCPSCQTPEENAEAEINEATTSYGRDPFGRVIGFPKIEGVL